MITHNVQQGSKAWLSLRAGIPTASQFDRIFTSGGDKPVGQPVSGEARRNYLNELISERILGEPGEQFISTWMGRGMELEKAAVQFYEFQQDQPTEVIGFVTNDAGTIGASPDRFVGANGQLEIKVPAPHTHVGYMLGYKSVGKKYRAQVQGQLWITGREWSDTLSYHPDMPPALIRYERDEEYIAGLAEAVNIFSADLEREWAELSLRFGMPNKLRPEEVIPDNAFGISAEDVAVLVSHYRAEGLM